MMENTTFLKKQISTRFEEFKEYKNNRYDSLENPEKLLKHYERELDFFNEGKRTFARTIYLPQGRYDDDYLYLFVFFVEDYPRLELDILTAIYRLEEEVNKLRRK